MPSTSSSTNVSSPIKRFRAKWITKSIADLSTFPKRSQIIDTRSAPSSSKDRLLFKARRCSSSLKTDHTSQATCSSPALFTSGYSPLFQSPTDSALLQKAHPKQLRRKVTVYSPKQFDQFPLTPSSSSPAACLMSRSASPRTQTVPDATTGDLDQSDFLSSDSDLEQSGTSIILTVNEDWDPSSDEDAIFSIYYPSVAGDALALDDHVFPEEMNSIYPDRPF